MKTSSIILFIVSFTFSANSFAQDEEHSFPKIKVEESSQYLPEYLDNIYISMPLADFESIKDTSLVNISEYDTPMWIEVNERVTDNGIEEVLYKFDKEENGINPEKPLYQINIKFLDLDDQDDYVNDKLGEPFKHNEEDENEWIFRTDKDYLLIIKEFEDTIQIIATMAGTEWETSK
jgi:hypothetical protein